MGADAVDGIAEVEMTLRDDGGKGPRRMKPLDQLGITIPEFIKYPGLLLEYRQDRIRRIASIDHVGKWMITEIFPSNFGVLGEGNIKESGEVGGRGGCIRC